MTKGRSWTAVSNALLARDFSNRGCASIKRILFIVSRGIDDYFCINTNTVQIIIKVAAYYGLSLDKFTLQVLC